MPPQASRVSCGVPRSRSAVAARRRSPTFKFPGTDVALPVQVLCQIFFQERPLLALSPRTASDRIPAHRACSSGRATGGYPPEAGSGQEADLSSTAPPQSLYFPAPICGSGPSRCNPCQARTLSTMNALSAPTVQMSATPSRKNSPVAAAPPRSAPTKRDNAAPQVLPAASAPRIIAVSSAMMRRLSLLRWTRSRGESSPRHSPPTILSRARYERRPRLAVC